MALFIMLQLSFKSIIYLAFVQAEELKKYQ